MNILGEDIGGDRTAHTPLSCHSVGANPILECPRGLTIPGSTYQKPNIKLLRYSSKSPFLTLNIALGYCFLTIYGKTFEGENFHTSGRKWEHLWQKLTLQIDCWKLSKKCKSFSLKCFWHVKVLWNMYILYVWRKGDFRIYVVPYSASFWSVGKSY